MLKTAIEAAKGAGKIICERYQSKGSVRMKSFRDLVTDADIAAECFILELIKKRFPGHSVLSEEAGGRCSTINGSPYNIHLPDCVATNGLIHDDLLAVFTKSEEAGYEFKKQ